MDRTGLVKMPGRAFVYRRRIPAECRTALGKTEWFVSLDTHDEAEAMRRYPEVHGEFERKLALARAGTVEEPDVHDFVIAAIFVDECRPALD